MQLPIYLDYNATTPCLPEVVEAMIPYFAQHFGNASSKNYLQGLVAEDAVECAREQVATLVNATPQEIIFTSSATEAINTAIKGYLNNFAEAHIITVATEHKAVLETCASLTDKGITITYLPVQENGMVALSAIKNAVRPITRLLVIMLANNETGVLQPIKEIYQLAQSLRIPLFTDATQAVGKIPVNAAETADLLCFSAHKMYGPKGVGALYINKKSAIHLHPLLHGGGHERNVRSGTLNVPAIVGFGVAAEYVQQCMYEEIERLLLVRNRLEQALATLPNVTINGQQAPRLPHVTNATFSALPTSNLVKLLSTKVAISSGSACSSVVNQPSHVLTAMGIDTLDALNSVRFSLGKYTTDSDIDSVIEEVKQAVTQLQSS